MQTLCFEIISLIFQTGFLLRSLHYTISHGQSLHILCPSSKCIFLGLQPSTYSSFSWGIMHPLGSLFCMRCPYLHQAAPSVPSSFSSFVKACIYFQRLLYSAFYVQCFKSFYSPEHSQLSILSRRGRWIFLEVIIQGKKTRPHYLIDFTSHLNEWYVGTTSKCFLKWLIWSFLFSDSGRTKKSQNE